jgi:hypothetical protein
MGFGVNKLKWLKRTPGTLYRCPKPFEDSLLIIPSNSV